MDFKVAWSPEAIEDLESIAEYIGRDSEFYARAVAKPPHICSRRGRRNGKTEAALQLGVTRRII